jgi:hypothetical protein
MNVEIADPSGSVSAAHTFLSCRNCDERRVTITGDEMWVTYIPAFGCVLLK